MTHLHDRLNAYVFFLKPQEAVVGWEQTDLWFSASSIPGVQVRQDVEGNEARRFHALTSGQTLLYDEEGTLIFSGGITSARGHAGDNRGRSTIIALLTGEPTLQTKTPVFGCALFSASTGEAEDPVL